MTSDISDMSSQNRASKRALIDLGNLNGFRKKLGEDGRLGKGGHMENIDPTLKFELD